MFIYQVFFFLLHFKCLFIFRSNSGHTWTHFEAANSFGFDASFEFHSEKINKRKSICIYFFSFVCIFQLIFFSPISVLDLQGSNDDKSPGAPLSTASEIQNLRDQLEQQAIQTREALFQLMQVREQLISETNARIEAQVRININAWFIWMSFRFYDGKLC